MVKQNKISGSPCFKIVSAQTCYFGQGTSIFKSLSPKIFSIKIKKSKKQFSKLHIVYLYKSKTENCKTDDAHFYKLYLLKWFIFSSKQYFGMFKNSNTRKESKLVRKNRFLSCTLSLCKTKQDFRLTTPIVQNCVCSNALLWSKDKHF